MYMNIKKEVPMKGQEYVHAHEYGMCVWVESMDTYEY